MAIKLTTRQRDRAAGVLLGQACGDALGVPYEFARPPEGEPQMVGGGLGNYEPGEWSDDTQMAVCIARVAATGADLTGSAALDAIATAFEEWYAGRPADVGSQTSAVLTRARVAEGSPAARLRAAAARVHEQTGRSAGNGALMRTAVVGLSRLEDREATAAAARAIAELTHFDPLAGDSCVIWSELVRVAVLEGRLNAWAALDLIPEERRTQWAAWITEALRDPEPARHSPNGFTVTALQAALGAIAKVGSFWEGPAHFRGGLGAAVHAGNDTDTVAAIAGGLLGGMHGASAVPAQWRRKVHGWPRMRSHDLLSLALLTASHGRPDRDGWPLAPNAHYGWEQRVAVPHPDDEGVLLGSMADLHHASRLGVDAVVSLCRLGPADLAPAGVEPQDHVEVWLVDSDNPEDNPHLDFVLDDAARAVQAFRNEGKRVLLHCVAAEHRTPSVAVRYAALLGKDPARSAPAIRALLPSAPGRARLWASACRGPAIPDLRPEFDPDTRAMCQDLRRPMPVSRGSLPPLTKDDLQLLRSGLARVEMEDKWIALLGRDNMLRLWRSWTGLEIYRATIEPNGEGGKVVQLLVEQDPAVYTGSLDDESRQFTTILENVLWHLRDLRAGWGNYGPVDGATAARPSDAKRVIA